MGDPGRLSLEDRDRFKEDRLRLVCSRLDCLVIFLNSELRFLLRDNNRKREEGLKTHLGTSRCPIRRSLPVLAVLPHGPLVPTGHFTLVASFACRTHFDGGVLKRRGCDGHLVSTLMTVNHAEKMVSAPSVPRTHKKQQTHCLFAVYWDQSSQCLP